MTEPLHELFSRLDPSGEPLPLPPVGGIRRRGRQLRVRRRLLAGGAAACAVLAVVGLVHLGSPSGRGSHDPARPTETRTSVSPTGTSPVDTGPRSADGLLRPGDLGDGEWIRGTETGDSTPPTRVEVPGCVTGGTGRSVTVTGTGSHRLYRGRTPQHAEWILDEAVLKPAGGVPASLTELFRAAARGCATVTGGSSGGVVLAATDTLLVTGTLLPAGSVGYAQAYALAGDRVITLDALPGGAAGSIPLPGQGQWMIDVTIAAVERITGTRPVAPPPNAAARAAASKFVTPTAVITVPRPEQQDTGAAAGTQPPTPPPANWFPEAESLDTASDGTPVRWAAEDPIAGEYRADQSFVISSLQCGQASAEFRGRYYHRRYRWEPGDGDPGWLLNVGLFVLGRGGGDDARAAVHRARTCPAGKLAARSVSVPMPDGSFLLERLAPDARTKLLTAVTVKGDTLIQVVLVPAGDRTPVHMVADRAWMATALEAARSHAP